MISITSDIADAILQQTLNQNTFGLNHAIERMTTGYKINHAKDNAANYSIAKSLSVKISSMLQVQQNAADGIDLLQTAEGGLGEINTLLQRLRALATQASNGNYGAQSREALQQEADQIIAQIQQIKETIQYNGMNLYETKKEESTDPVSKLAKSARVQSEPIGSISQPRRTLSATSSQPSPQGEGASAPINEPAQTPVSAPKKAASQSGDIAGAESFAGKETRTILIDGVEYRVRNKVSTVNDLSYSKDSSTGAVTLYSSNFEIYGQADKEHNLKISGISNDIHGGGLDDILEEIAGRANVLYGDDGDDKITLSQQTSQAHGGSGNDILTVNANDTYLYGGDGDDTININGSALVVQGDAGNDTFNINRPLANKGVIKGGDGDDHFNILAWIFTSIDGGAGVNTFTSTVGDSYNPLDNNILANVVGGNAYIVDLAVNESKEINIGGIKYTVTNDTNAQSLIYKVSSDGIITFSKTGERKDRLTIRGEANKQHNVVLGTEYLNFYGGNLNDNIESKSAYCNIYGGDGDDTIISYYSNVYTGSGNNTITATTYSRVFCGNGDNNITVKDMANYISCGTGNSIINVSGNQNMIAGNSSGTVTITDNGIDTFIANCGDYSNSEAISIAAIEQNKVVSINGVQYTLSECFGSDSSLFYSKNPVTNEISFCANSLVIRAADDVAQNVNLYGVATNFYGGSKDDNITIYAYWGRVYGGEGNDTITNYGIGSNIWGEGGDDHLILNGDIRQVYGGSGSDIIDINTLLDSSSSVNGESGDDTYNIHYGGGTIQDTGGNNIYNLNTDNANISGGDGNDTFYVTGSNNLILGAGGDDYIVIDGNSNTIDGGTGNDYYIDNGINNKIQNVTVDPNSGTLRFSYLDEIKTFTIGGKTYTVKNNFSGINELRYSINPNTGVITVSGSNFRINAESQQQSLLNVRGNNNFIYGSDLSDKITIEQGANNIIDGGKGNDILIMNSANNSLLGGDGDDTITLKASTNLQVDGGKGNDIFQILSNNNTNIILGSGDDKITLSGSFNTITGDEGKNNIIINSSNNTITAGDGDNRLVVNGSDNHVTAGKGLNSIGVQGSGNNVTIQNAKGDINIIGNNNTVCNTRGENNVIIKGNSNSYSSTAGDKAITITGNHNDILTGNGKDTFDIKGDSNTLESTGGNNEFNIKGDFNSIQGGVDIDNIKLNGNNNIANGGDENDTYMISKGSNNTIDGESGRNTMINNGKNTHYTNVIDITPRPFELNLKIDIDSGKASYINTKISFNLFDFGVDFMSSEGALESLENIDALLTTVSDEITNIGTVINRLESVAEAQSIKLANMISSRSTIQDADVAEESSSFIRYQILQQASATLMASSRNLRAENVMGLLNGLNV